MVLLLSYMSMASILVLWSGPFEQTFVHLSHGGSIWNLALIGLAISKEKTSDNLEFKWAMNDLDLWYSYWFMSRFSWLHLPTLMSKATIGSEKIFCFTFFLYKSIRDQIWPCRKIDQGQPSVIIWINFVVLEHSMLHTKFQGHRHFGSGEEDFFLSFYYIREWRPSWSRNLDRLNKLSFPHPKQASDEIWLWLAQWLFRRRCLKSVEDGVRRTTYDVLLYGGLPIL